MPEDYTHTQINPFFLTTVILKTNLLYGLSGSCVKDNVYPLASVCVAACKCTYTHSHRENASDQRRLLIFGSNAVPNMSAVYTADIFH